MQMDEIVYVEKLFVNLNYVNKLGGANKKSIKFLLVTEIFRIFGFHNHVLLPAKLLSRNLKVYFFFFFFFGHGDTFFPLQTYSSYQENRACNLLIIILVIWAIFISFFSIFSLLVLQVGLVSDYDLLALDSISGAFIVIYIYIVLFFHFHHF